MTVAAQLVTRVVADIGDADKNLDKIGSKSQSTGDKLKGALGHMLGIAGGVTAANLAGQAFGFLKDQVGDVFAKAQESERIMSETNQILADTHNKAGMSAQAIGDLATKMSEVTPFDDEVVQSTENMLLTFTNIGKKTFPDATKAALDMAQKFHIGPEQAAVQLGKALNDPAQGLSALQRIGITFTDSQKQQIQAMQKAGDTAGAQKIILKELGREFGGVAEAAGKTTAGKMAILGTKIDNVKERIGTALLPMLANAATAGMNLADKVQGLLTHLGEFAAWLQAHQPVLDMLKAALIGIGIAILISLVPSFVAWAISAGAAAIATLAAMAPIVLLGLAIGGVILVIKALIDHGDQVKAFFGHIKDAIGAALGAIGKAIGNLLGTIGGFVGGALGKLGQFKDFIGGALSKAWNGFKSLVGKVWDGISGAIKGGINTVIGFINGFIRFLDSIQIHIPAVGVGPVHTPALNWNGMGIPQIPYLAEGGIVTRPTLAMIGEAGPEAVVPLNKAGAVGGGMGFGQTIHIHGADANQVLSMLRREALLLRMSGRV